jgi:hypothetical protein
LSQLNRQAEELEADGQVTAAARLRELAASVIREYPQLVDTQVR